MQSAAMSGQGMNIRESRWRTAGVPQRQAKFLPLAQLRKLRECEQVAATCYRVRRGEIQFLLIRTRAGRWIFPKGGTEPGLTHAQSAALEAFEEAGVHGRMEEVSFTSYIHNKGEGRNKASEAVNVYLCEVARLEPPQEIGRNPTWFSAEEAKQALREERAADYGNQLSQVVDRALKRVERLHNHTSDNHRLDPRRLETRSRGNRTLVNQRLDVQKLEVLRPDNRSRARTDALRNVRFIDDVQARLRRIRV